MVMGFKDFVETDLSAFLNLNDFADMHKLGDKELPMIIEEDSFNQLAGRTREVEYDTQNLYESVTTISLKAADYKKPAVGKRLTLDGEKYYVINSSVSGGILKISLVANESYG
jgi:hypothetical protein